MSKQKKKYNKIKKRIKKYKSQILPIAQQSLLPSIPPPPKLPERPSRSVLHTQVQRGLWEMQTIAQPPTKNFLRFPAIFLHSHNFLCTSTEFFLRNRQKLRKFVQIFFLREIVHSFFLREILEGFF